MQRARSRFFVGAISLVLAFAGAGLATTPAFAESSVPLDHVIDGDTLVVRGGTHVRLLGIDTPEKGECGYSEAKKELKTLVTGKAIALTGSNKDHYGRRLAYVDANGIDVGAELIKAGLARPRYNITDGYGANIRDGRYFALAKTAKHLCGLDMNEFTTNNGENSRPLLETRYVSASESANVRVQPDANSAIQSKLPRGQKVEVGAALNGFRQLGTGGWVSAQLLSSTKPSAQPAPKPTATTTKTTNNASGSCPVKGNINRKGEKIFHVKGGRWYDKTNAEQCFQTAAEARSAGYRASKNG